MDGAAFVAAPELDLGKLFQSITARYEEWAHSERALFKSIHPQEIVSEYISVPDSELQRGCIEHWSRILSTSTELATVKGRFYMGLHLIRMVPFRLKVSEEQALYALANGIRWMSRATTAVRS